MKSDLDAFCSEVYDGVDDPQMFEKSIQTATRMLGVARAHLFLLGGENGENDLNFTANFDPDFLQEYHTEYINIDYRIESIRNKRVNSVLLEQDINDENQLRSNPLHNELFPKHKVYALMGSNISVNGSLGWFGVSSLRKGMSFTQDQQTLFERIIPHARRALHLRQLRQEARAQMQAFQSANDSMTHGLILTSGDNIEYANKRAKDILAAGFLYMRKAELTCADPEERQKLQLAVRRANSGRAPLVRLADKRTGDIYAVQMFNPLPRFIDGKLESARNMTYKIVPLRGPEPPTEQTIERMKQFFQLSESETRVISASLSMTSLAQFSSARNIQEDTARKQLKSAMRKIGVQSQKQLFQLHEQFKIFL
ncbi:helix-turn-helix transcriptional regulator [Roseibium sp. SCP14]|uniref:helix-turn-helix transcriptional regulator n=1 Tax=Roseibium sp. SCP14 TaxID=3141375 RepID=UPI0033382F31